MITSNILKRVLHVKYKNNIGSAFTIDLQNKQFLVSARHIFEELIWQDTIEIMQNEVWKPLYLSPIFCENGVDIIVFPLSERLTPAEPLDVTMDGMTISQDAYFLWFPYGLRTELGDQNNYYPFPFVKKCSVSAFDFSSTPKVIFLDGHNNKGFSWWPLVFSNPTTHKLQVAGVISSYVRDLDQEKIERGISENSGIFQAHSIVHVTDKINRSGNNIFM